MRQPGPRSNSGPLNPKSMILKGLKPAYRLLLLGCMETLILSQMQTRVEALWIAIQGTKNTIEQERLRSEYRRALDTYRLQKMINQGVNS